MTDDVELSGSWGGADLVKFIIPCRPVGKMQSRITFHCGEKLKEGQAEGHRKFGTRRQDQCVSHS